MWQSLLSSEMRPSSCVLHACQSFLTHQFCLFNAVTPEVFWRASLSFFFPFQYGSPLMALQQDTDHLASIIFFSDRKSNTLCQWTCTKCNFFTFLSLVPYRPVCSSRCSWVSLSFHIQLWSPAAPQVMAACVLHTNKPVSLRGTVYCSTQHPSPARIQRRL